jgi:hypothetical protein
MFPPEINLTPTDQNIVFRIRQIIGDEKEVFVDDKQGPCTSILASGTMYLLDEPKGYPIQVFVNGGEVTSGVQVVGDKYLMFSTPTLFDSTHIVVIYNHFRHSDLDIINTYDSGATTYLSMSCGLAVEDLGPDLLILSTAYLLLTKDLNDYLKGAVSLSDSDSRFEATARPEILKGLLDLTSSQLLKGIEAKTRCKMFSLPVYKIE